MSGSSGGGGSSNTVTNQVQIPAYEQQFSQNNQNLAASLGQQPYPLYQGALVQPFTQMQNQGMVSATDAAGAYMPDLQSAEALTSGAFSPNWATNGGAGLIANSGLTGDQWISSGINNISNAGNQAMTGGAGAGLGTLMGATQMGPGGLNIGQYMSPYVQQSLAPQITALQTQLGQEQNQINAQATGANAFGDARQGAAQALQNFYGNQALSGLEAQGFNTAYSNALQTGMGEQQLGLGEQQTQGQLGQALSSLGLNLGQLALNQGQAAGQIGLGMNQSVMQAGQALGNLGLGENQQQLAAANQMANLGGLQQSLGLTGANALFNVGQQQQQLGQQELNTAYQQFLNQVNWPFQMLNVQESALSNSPYNMVNATTLPQANMTAQGFGAGVGALGSLASLFGGGGSNAPFGGTAYPA